MKYSYEELAGMIDDSLLHPTLTDQELEDGASATAAILDAYPGAKK